MVTTMTVRQERGALDIVITKRSSATFPDERTIDVVYHKTDVGIKNFLSFDEKLFQEWLDMAREFCDGYNQAVSDMRGKASGYTRVRRAIEDTKHLTDAEVDKLIDLLKGLKEK